MTEGHAIRYGWAGYLRVALCRCGWRSLPRKTALQAERAGREHLERPG